MLLRDAVNPSEIQLSENDEVSPSVQILRTGKFKHPKYGKFEITRKVLSEMKSNFDSRVRGQDINFDYFHESDKEASGWPKALELREAGTVTELWATAVDWTPTARKKLKEKELRYFSPDFSFQWENPETGTVHSNVLFGGGLVNRPHIKNMAPIELSEGENEMTELETVQAANLKLSEDVTKATATAESLAAENAALKAENEKLKTESEAAVVEKQKAEEAKKLSERESEFTVMLAEGKAVVAQKDSWMKQDMAGFVKNAAKLNMSGSGDGAGNGDGAKEAPADQIHRLAEAKMGEDKKLSYTGAVAMVLKEQPELRKSANI